MTAPGILGALMAAVFLALGIFFAALALVHAGDWLRTLRRGGADPRPYPPRACDLVPPVALAAAFLTLFWSLTR